MPEPAKTVVVARPQGGSVQVLIDSPSPAEDARTITDTAVAAILETIFTIFDTGKTSKTTSGNLLCANAAAASLACGSILAGHASEADEYGDIAFWLGEGEYDKGHELEILQSLALQDMIPENARLKEMEISPKTHLPATVNAPEAATAEVTSFIGLLRQMSAIRVFCLQGELSVYVLVGRYSADSLSGWCGLLGLGVQS
ncbi:hypothetical protein C8Q70DRAFT_1052352 [Cubamyces menziesii]|nr:hypothetical protein C8Q70DRAFT_1052352 [Cubamyces menziesii]